MEPNHGAFRSEYFPIREAQRRKLLIALWCYLEPPVLQCRIGTSGWASLPNMRALHNCLKRNENDLALKL